MATTLKNAQQRATMAAKEERARDAALAMQEYEAEKLAIGIKTARLRALRLAKEAESNERTKRKNPGTIPPVSFPKIISAHSDGAVRKIKRTKFSAHTADQDARQGCGARKLGRTLGLFKDRLEHTGKDGGPISLRQLLQEIDGTTRGLPNSRIRDGGEG